jgi:hypothetical protein
MENNAIVNMSTKIWGPPMWITLHTITFSYPINPTDEDKKKYKKFFMLVGDMLPCILCKKSYNEFIGCGETKLDNGVMMSKDTLTKWLYHLHNKVNLKLGVDYEVTYEDVCKKYNSYIVSCTPSNNNNNKIDCEKSIVPKNISFKNSNYNYTNCVIIPYKIAKHYINYAKLRDLSDNDLHVINNYEKCKQNKDAWIKRNVECHKIITYMRENNIPAIEESGQWAGLPTKQELKLIMQLSSTIDKVQLVELIKKLPKCECEYKRIYKLVKK